MRIISFLVAILITSNAFAKPEILKDIRGFISLDSIFINQQNDGIHTKSNNLKNPFSNINGVSLGVSYHVPDTNFYISAKSNRLLNFPIHKQVSVYNGSTFLKNASLSFQSQNDVISLGYRAMKAIIPFVFVSNSELNTKLTDNFGSVSKRMKTIFYGVGVNAFITKDIAISTAFVLPNNDADTAYGISISLNWVVY